MKKILITIGILFVVIAIFIGTKIAEDLKQESLLTKEVNDFLENGKINEKIATKKEYEKVERILKKDFKDFDEAMNELLNVYATADFDTLLTAENYAKDGPKFTQSKKIINDMKDELENKISILENIVSDDQIAEKIAKNELDEYYSDLYKNYLKSAKLKESIEDIIEENKRVYNKLENTEKVINFLVKNSKKWEIKDKQFGSSDDEFIEEYNTLIENYNKNN